MVSLLAFGKEITAVDVAEEASRVAADRVDFGRQIGLGVAVPMAK